MIIEEGFMPFMGYKTYWRSAGEGCADKKPIILLHGGPGSTHNYFEVLFSAVFLYGEKEHKFRIFAVWKRSS